MASIPTTLFAVFVWLWLMASADLLWDNSTADWLLAGGWCWFSMREQYCWLVGWQTKRTQRIEVEKCKPWGANLGQYSYKTTAERVPLSILASLPLIIVGRICGEVGKCMYEWTSAAACQKTPFAHASLHETPHDFSDAVAAEGRYFRFLFSLAPMQQNVSQATCRMVEHPTGVNKLLGCQGAFGPCPTGDSMPDSFHTPCVWTKPWKKKNSLHGQRQWRMYTPGHPCHGPGFGPKNCWRSPKNCWRRINILLRDDTCCMFSIFPLCFRVSFELPLYSRVSFELWVCRRLIFVTTIFKTRPGVQLNPGSATGQRWGAICFSGFGETMGLTWCNPACGSLSLSLSKVIRVTTK